MTTRQTLEDAFIDDLGGIHVRFDACSDGKHKKCLRKERVGLAFSPTLAVCTCECHERKEATE